MTKEQQIRQIKDQINTLRRELYQLDTDYNQRVKKHNREYNSNHKEQLRANYLRYKERHSNKEVESES